MSFTAVAESRKTELRRKNIGAGCSACGQCRKPILPFSDYWEGAAGDYCDGCRPQGAALLVLNLNDELKVTSEAG